MYNETCTEEYVQWDMYSGTCTEGHVQRDMYSGTCTEGHVQRDMYSEFQTQTCFDFRSSDDSFLEECCGCFSLALCGRGDSGEDDGECLLHLRNTQHI